ncbi:hypothetical protein H1C71_012302, partial [Ictidomys tridecemlineatus]
RLHGPAPTRVLLPRGLAGLRRFWASLLGLSGLECILPRPPPPLAAALVSPMSPICPLGDLRSLGSKLGSSQGSGVLRPVTRRPLQGGGLIQRQSLPGRCLGPHT